MTIRRSFARTGKLWLVIVILLFVAGAGLGAYFLFVHEKQPEAPPHFTPPRSTNVKKAVHHFCGDCHAYPPAETFPRWAWQKEVERGFSFWNRSNRKLKVPSIDEVIKYYEKQAPDRLPELKIAYATTPMPVRFKRVEIAALAGANDPAISHLKFVPLTDAKQPELLACEMRHGQILSYKPNDTNPKWTVLGKVANPGHVEVVDLDKDGFRDVIVADLGSFPPTDRRCGKVVWLRNDGNGKFTPHTLLSEVGRVSDVQAADIDGDGKCDLVVAVFGWQREGGVVLLTNQTRDWKNPTFAAKVLDDRHGAIHVPVTDVDKDGRPDFIALFAQEHETIVAFLNRGKTFEKREIFTASHPAYGSSGIQLVDMDNDGDKDVLFSNGDVLDDPHLLKPYHSVQWLENSGRFPYPHHHIANMYGVHRAVAGDIDGDGDMDVVAVSYLPGEHFPQRSKKKLDAIILLERLDNTKFARHPLEKVTCDHVVCILADLYGRNRLDLVTANFVLREAPSAVQIWKNDGPFKAAPR